MRSFTRMENPCAKRRSQSAPPAAVMGNQSQKRISNKKRAYQLSQSSTKKQRTVDGSRLFDPLKDCRNCRLTSKRTDGSKSHAAHHPKCPNNDRAKGILYQTTLNQRKIDKALQEQINRPFSDSEKCNRNCTKEDLTEFLSKGSNVWRRPQESTNIPSPKVPKQ